MSLLNTICGFVVKSVCEKYLDKEKINFETLKKLRKDKLKKIIRNLIATGWWGLISIIGFILVVMFVICVSTFVAFFISLLFNEALQLIAWLVISIVLIVFCIKLAWQIAKLIDKKLDYVFSRTSKACHRLFLIKNIRDEREWREKVAEKEKEQKEQKEQNNNGNNKDIEALIGCLIWIVLIIYFCWINNFHYFKTVEPNKLIVHDKITNRLRTVVITEKKDINLAWRLLWRFKYLESDLPCSIIRIDKFKQEADFINVNGCGAK